MERFDSNWGTTTDWLIILFGTLSNASLMPKHIWPDIWLWGLHPESPGSAVWLLFCSDSQSSTCSLVRFIMLPTVAEWSKCIWFCSKIVPETSSLTNSVLNRFEPRFRAKCGTQNRSKTGPKFKSVSRCIKPDFCFQNQGSMYFRED